MVDDASRVKLPPWLGDDALHETHRSALLHKLPEHYSEYGWEIPDPKVDYLWPRPVEGGRDGEYELCPAFWKKKEKKKSTESSKTSTKSESKSLTVVRAAKGAKQKKAVGKPTEAKKNRRGTVPVGHERRYPSRHPRRSTRLAGK